MTISYQWLQQYLPLSVSVEELSHILTSIGLEVEGEERIDTIKGGLEGLVIGEVLTCSKHPNADKLSVTTVSLGNDEPVQIVCGAPNVAAGQRVVVAPVGTTVHPTSGEPFLIKKAKIRGEESCGMICAEDEIGLGNSHAGIMILPADAPIGQLARVYFNIPEADKAIHIGLTPNRSDANSHLGVARDVCAYLAHHRGGTFQPVVPQVSVNFAATSSINVNIIAANACPRYAGLSISGVKVAPSPEWLQQRLNTIGVRSINNIVDVTNYVLHEYGQPLHAFDAHKIAGNTIMVMHLDEGTHFIGLDEKERKLRASDLMICDANGPIAMAGVFGGNNSGITESTTEVFLESAYFDPMTVRKTSMHHGLRTDAATHFEKGVDINNVLPAMLRAASLIMEVAGGSVSSQVTDVYPVSVEQRNITTNYSYIHSITGKEYGAPAINNILAALGFGIVHATEQQLTVTVPTNKSDVFQPADLAEEVLRIDGLDNVAIPAKLNMSLTKPMPNDRQQRERVAQLLCSQGLNEIVTNSIVNSSYYTDRTDLVRMINSLSSELDVMRPSMLESGLEVLQYNYNRKNQDLVLFEFGNVYTLSNGAYQQQSQLALWATGNVLTENWQKKTQKADVFYMKGLVNSLIKAAGIGGVSISYSDNANSDIEWKWRNQQLCMLRKVDAERLKRFDIKQDVYFAEVSWGLWLQALAAVKVKYSEVAKYPAVSRDLALVLDSTVAYQQVQEVTDKLKLQELSSYGLFDVFESEKLGAGKKSYALNFTFQLQDRTLTDSETDQLMKKLADAYKSKLNAQIRE